MLNHRSIGLVAEEHVSQLRRVNVHNITKNTDICLFLFEFQQYVE